MGVGEAILAVGAGARPASFEQFQQAIDPEWIDEALAATGKASLRRRKFPAEYVIWLVIGMALFFDRAIAQVVQHLDLVLPTVRRARLTNGAIVRARNRLGPAPLAALFRRTAAVWAGAAAATTRWRGLAVFGLDGTTLRLADTPENVATFGRPGTSRGGAAAGYPQLRCVVLSVLRHHLLAAAHFGPYRTSELELAAALWSELPDRSLVILDRGFASYALFHRLGDRAHTRHWLVRARGGRNALRWTRVERLGPGDELVDLTPSHGTRAAHRDLPPTLRVRALQVRGRGFRPYVVLTSLLDAAKYPAAELGALYHERWELELTFDELKTHTLGRVETLRSKAPARVEQEVWGLWLAYNLVRLIMARAAERVGPPARHPRASSRYAARPTRTARHPRTTDPSLPARREDQNEQLPA